MWRVSTHELCARLRLSARADCAGAWCTCESPTPLRAQRGSSAHTPSATPNTPAARHCLRVSYRDAAASAGVHGRRRAAGRFDRLAACLCRPRRAARATRGGGCRCNSRSTPAAPQGRAALARAPTRPNTALIRPRERALCRHRSCGARLCGRVPSSGRRPSDPRLCPNPAKGRDERRGATVEFAASKD